MSFDLHAWREWIGLSQRELAALTGITPMTVSELERGRAAVSAGTLQRLAHVFGVSRATLLHQSPAEAWQDGWRPPEHDRLLAPTADGAGTGEPEQRAM